MHVARSMSKVVHCIAYIYIVGCIFPMGRSPCCAKVGLQKGQWTANEDQLLIKYIQANGEGHWNSLPQKAGDI